MELELRERTVKLRDVREKTLLTDGTKSKSIKLSNFSETVVTAHLSLALTGIKKL